MAIQLKLQQKMAQQLVMTPQLQQAIKLLQLSHLEMAEVLRQELEENPILEERQEGGDEDPGNNDGTTSLLEFGQDHTRENDGMMGLASTGTSDETGVNKTDEALARDLSGVGDAPVDATPVPTDKEVQRDVDWESYLDSHTYSLPATAGTASGGAGDLPSFESTIAAPTSLLEHLRWQVQMADLTDTEKSIALLLIEEINEDGYLAPDAATLVLEELSEYDICEEEILSVINELQSFDPPGVASRTLRECLLKQMQHMSKQDPLAIEIIDKYLPEIEKRQYQKVAKKLKVPLSVIGETLKQIVLLEPRPGRSFSEKPAHYISPDIYVQKLNNEWVILHNEDGMPKLQISDYYRDALGGSKGETKSYLQDKLRSAAWLIRSIHMRQRTLHKVMESILNFQADFFDKGPAHLKPLILKDVAEDVEMHESTISRVTTNKYVHTPQGIFELKYFFNSSINKMGGDAIASESVRNRIQELIGNENPRKPLSDQALVKLLREFEINIARRTVAKYREMMKIPPSSKRKQVF